MRTIATLFLLTHLAALAACSSTGDRDGSEASLAVSDAVLERSLALRNPRFEGEGAGRALLVDLENVGREPLSVEARVSWFGAGGKPLVLTPRQVQTADLGTGARTALRFAPVPVAASSYRFLFARR